MSGSAPDPRQREIFDPGPNAAIARAKREDCEGCGKKLRGRQERFCSQKCGSEWWDLFHPRLNTAPPAGGPREVSIRDALLGILHDGQWHTALELAELVRAFPHSVSARLSELRRKGFHIESDAPNGCSRRAHRFRLVLS